MLLQLTFVIKSYQNHELATTRKRVPKQQLPVWAPESEKILVRRSEPDKNDQEQIQARTGFSPKHRTIISANGRENKIFISELESSYERPMGLSSSSMHNFGLYSNPTSLLVNHLSIRSEQI